MTDHTDLTTTPTGEEATWIAHLKRGASYTMGVNPETNTRYVRGTDYPITDDTKAKLEEKAVDLIDTKSVDDDDLPILEPKCKFDFRRVGERVRTAEPRRRSRAA